MEFKTKFIIVFFILNLVISSFYLDSWQNGNTVSRALPIITYFESGTFSFDKYHEETCDKSNINGHYYTDKAPLPTYVVLPFFGILVKTGIITPDANGSLLGPQIFLLGGFLTGSLPFAIIVLMAFLAIRNKELSFSPIFLSMLPFYGSFIFVYAGTYFPHIFSGFLLLCSFLCLKKSKYLIAGLLAGLSFLCEYNLAMIFMIWGILIIFKTKRANPFLQFSLGVLPSLLFWLFYNYYFTGSPFETMYSYHNFDSMHRNFGFYLPTLTSLWGLSFSWYRGLFFYSPFILLVIFTAIKFISRNGNRIITFNYLVIPVIIYYLFISSYLGWWGGWAYGPRFFTGISILLTFSGIILLSNTKFSKIAFWIIIVFGIASTFITKATLCYSIPSDVANPIFDIILPHFLNGEFNPNNLLTLIFGIKPIYAFLFFIFFFTGSLALLNFWYSRNSK